MINTEKKVTKPIFSNVDPELKQRIVKFSNQKCEGNESMAIRLMVRSYLDDYEKKTKKAN